MTRADYVYLSHCNGLLHTLNFWYSAISPPEPGHIFQSINKWGSVTGLHPCLEKEGCRCEITTHRWLVAPHKTHEKSKQHTSVLLFLLVIIDSQIPSQHHHRVSRAVGRAKSQFSLQNEYQSIKPAHDDAQALILCIPDTHNRPASSWALDFAS